MKHGFLGMVAAIALGSFAVPAFAANQPNYPVQESIPSNLATHALLLDVTRAGDRLVAVGEYGHIIYSDDQGATWTQAANVPTRATLTAITFTTNTTGWVVGHDAVILHTTDAGTTWIRQYIDPVLPDEIDPETGDIPTDRTLLTLHFFDSNHGLAMGAFSQALETFDGGLTWADRVLFTPEDIDDPYYFPEEYHLNGAFPGPDGSLFVAAEFGVVYRSIDGGVSFVEIQTPYEGSFWNGMGVNGSVLVFGMRGNLWRSDDVGETWYEVFSATDQSLGGGAMLDDGTIVLVGLGGAIIYSYDDGASFTPVIRPARRGHSNAAPAGDGRVVVVGEDGTAFMPGRAEDYTSN